jgi:arylsulfatase A-like enzyme
MPGAPQGMKEQDVTIAALLKEQGYATGQFGKNHLGDLDEHLPTNHGFDEFFGNLYHLNARKSRRTRTTRRPDHGRWAHLPRGPWPAREC